MTGVDGPFAEGVASGDATTSSVVLWTCIDVAGPVQLRWEVRPAHRPDGPPAAEGHVTTTADGDGTVHVHVGGLPAGQRWAYRFTAPDGRTSPVGHTATLADRPTTVTLGLACCADLSNGPFEGYRWLVDQRPDAVVHLGDYIYEHRAGGTHRTHHPDADCVTVADYRRRYRQYRRDAALRDLHAAAPWFTVWDDHEFANDAWTTDSPAHDRRRHHRSWDDRRRAAVQVNREWLPRGPEEAAGAGLARHRRIGDLLDLVLIDARMGGRERPPGGADGPTLAPTGDGPALLSDQQWAWLAEVLDRPAARWTVLVSSVQVSPLLLAALPHRRGRRLGLRPVVNPDQWDGFPGERQRLLDLLAPRRGTVLLVSGDLHGRFLTAAPGPGGPVPEVTIPAVSATPFADLVRRSIPLLPTPLLERWLRLVNRHVADLDLAAHGAATLTVDHDGIVVHTGPAAAVVQRVLPWGGTAGQAPDRVSRRRLRPRRRPRPR